jgi:CYTH domain-containing protein
MPSGSFPADFPELSRCYKIRQAYLTIPDNPLEVRVRQKKNVTAGHVDYYLTVKSRGSASRRTEITRQIGYEQFEDLWKLCADQQIEKTRRVYPIGHLRGIADELELEVDTFENHRFQISEIEFGSAHQLESFEPPSWFGQEVTDDERYINAWIATNGNPLHE